MTKLSFMAAEAQRLTGRMAAPRRGALQDALLELCETRWHELRGVEPASPLAHALWSVTPPCADLFVDLHATGDGRLTDTLAGLRPTSGMALLVLAEIERGDIEAIRIAYESMMLCDSPAAASVHAEQVGAALRGTLQRAEIERKFSRRPLLRALAIVAARTGRDDANAVTAAIRLLAGAYASQHAEPALDALREALQAAGVRFLAFDDDAIRYELHGQERKPVSRHRLCDMLAEIRRARLG